MPAFPILVALFFSVASQPEQPKTLRYLRHSKDRFVVESLVELTKKGAASNYLSTTTRPGEELIVSLHFSKPGRLLRATVTQKMQGKTQTVVATFGSGQVVLQRSNGIKNILEKVAPSVIVTSAPDWSDILQLAHRYDAKKGGKQSFAGLWLHPVQPHSQLTFTVERVGTDKIDNRKKLDRFQITLRSGAYLVWVDGLGRVVKIMVPGKPQTAVLLEGYEKVAVKLR